jgi:hypothetical protein
MASRSGSGSGSLERELAGKMYISPKYSKPEVCGVWCGVVWCGVVWCGVVWCGVVWCGVCVVVCGVVCGCWQGARPSGWGPRWRAGRVLLRAPPERRRPARPASSPLPQVSIQHYGHLNYWMVTIK